MDLFASVVSNFPNLVIPPADGPPTLDSVGEWFDSDHAEKKDLLGMLAKNIPMKEVLCCPIANEYFRQHCVREQNEENLIAVFELKSMKTLSGQELRKKSLEFYKTFLAYDSPLMLNLPSNKDIEQAFQDEKVTLELIEKLEYEVGQNLRDPFLRYLASDEMSECIPMCWFNKKLFGDKLYAATTQDKGKYLNNVMPWNFPASHACVVASSLARLLEEVVLDNMDTNKFDLDYEAVRQTAKYKQFIQKSAELQKVDLSVLTAAQRKSFFINVYNTLYAHAAIEKKGVPIVQLNRAIFMRKSKYTIGGLAFSLDQIYNGILRGNVRDWLIGSRFNDNDSRKQYCVSVDPRIHFALISLTPNSPCFSVAPPVVDGKGEELEDYLNTRAEQFLNYSVVVDVASKTMKLPKLFQNFKPDFAVGQSKLASKLSNAAIEDFIIRFTTKLTQAEKDALSCRKMSLDYQKAYMHIDWSCFQTCDSGPNPITRRVTEDLVIIEQQLIEKEIIEKVKRAVSKKM